MKCEICQTTDGIVAACESCSREVCDECWNANKCCPDEGATTTEETMSETETIPNEQIEIEQYQRPKIKPIDVAAEKLRLALEERASKTAAVHNLDAILDSKIDDAIASGQLEPYLKDGVEHVKYIYQAGGKERVVEREVKRKIKLREAKKKDKKPKDDKAPANGATKAKSAGKKKSGTKAKAAKKK